VQVAGQAEQEVGGLVDHLVDARVRAVHLVDHQDHREVRLQRLAEHEPGLRERALTCVDEQHHAVDHRQAALHLAAEVGVTRRVHHVDRDAVRVAGGGRRRAAVVDRRVLGEDRDALLALEVTRVEGALVHVGVLAERAGLPQHLVHERGLAVVDVRDDRDVAQVGARGGAGARGQPGGSGHAENSSRRRDSASIVPAGRRGALFRWGSARWWGVRRVGGGVRAGLPSGARSSRLPPDPPRPARTPPPTRLVRRSRLPGPPGSADLGRDAAVFVLEDLVAGALLLAGGP